MAYYTLVAFEGDHIASNPWGVAFGDHDKETVESERDSYIDNGWKRRELKIIKTATARQSEIDAAVDKLNAETGA